MNNSRLEMQPIRGKEKEEAIRLFVISSINMAPITTKIDLMKQAQNKINNSCSNLKYLSTLPSTPI